MAAVFFYFFFLIEWNLGFFLAKDYIIVRFYSPSWAHDVFAKILDPPRAGRLAGPLVGPLACGSYLNLSVFLLSKGGEEGGGGLLQVQTDLF